MRGRALSAALLVIAAALIAGPAAAKVALTGATITGPGLGGPLRIDGSEAYGLWDSGLDVVGGLDDTRSASPEELGLRTEELGSRYLVIYRFGHGRGTDDDSIRQDLYPYAKGGPVTYTPPGQELKVGIEMTFTAGWYESAHPCGLPCGTRPELPEEASSRFFDYLVEQGLPETDPVAAPSAESAPWSGIVAVLVGWLSGALDVSSR